MMTNNENLIVPVQPFISAPVTQSETLAELNNLAIPEVTEKALKDIETFKALAVTQALSFIQEDAQYASIREFKDVVAIVDTIEKSYDKKSADTGTTVNIAIQNMVDRFKDDC